jgi:hypothetical protein
MSSYLTSATASTTYQTITGMSSYLTTSSASTTYQPISTMSNYVLQSYLDANYNTSAYISNNFASLSATNTFLGGGSFGGALSFKGNTSIIDSKTFTVSSGCTFNCNSGSTVNFNGTTNINSNGFWNVPTGSSFLLQGNGVTFLELGPLALYSPISYSTNLNQTTFNGYIVFKTGFTIEGGQTIGIGTSGYGTGYIQVAGSGSYINIQNSGGFFSNWIEPTSTTSSASWYSTHTSSLSFGITFRNCSAFFADIFSPFCFDDPIPIPIIFPSISLTYILKYFLPILLLSTIISIVPYFGSPQFNS